MKGQLPPSLEQDLRMHAKMYAGQVTSILANFPSDEILKSIDDYLGLLKISSNVIVPSLNGDVNEIGNSSKEPRDDRSTCTNVTVTNFQHMTKRLVDLAERYRNGLKGYRMQVIFQLLLGYFVVERHLQHGKLNDFINKLFD